MEIFQYRLFLWIKFLSGISPSSEKVLKAIITESVLGPAYWRSGSSGITMVLDHSVRVTDLGLYLYFYMELSSLTWTICRRFCPCVHFWLLYLKKGGGIGAWNHVHVFSSALLMNMSVLMPIPYFYHDSSAVTFEIRDGGAPGSSLYHLGFFLAGVCVSIWILRFVFNLCDYFCWNFDGNCIRSADCFW